MSKKLQHNANYTGKYIRYIRQKKNNLVYRLKVQFTIFKHSENCSYWKNSYHFYIFWDGARPRRLQKCFCFRLEDYRFSKNYSGLSLSRLGKGRKKKYRHRESSRYLILQLLTLFRFLWTNN